MDRINEIKKVNIKNIPVIQSFSGSGAIGTILSTFLVNALKMEHVAVIHSRSIPPVAIIKDGIIEHPIRLFQSEKLALMSCEIPISYSNTQPFLKMLIDYYIKQGVSHIVPVGGLPIIKDPANDSRCFAISTNLDMIDFLEQHEVKILDEGILYGTVVETLELCDARGFNGCFSLLAECDPGVASYFAAKQIILELAKLFNFEFDEDQFNEVTSTIQNRIDESARIVREETFNKTRESHL